MSICILWDGIDSDQGYQKEILEEIDAQVHFERCIYLSKDHDQVEYDKKYTVISYDTCERNRYRDCYNMNSLKALDKDILEKMRPYESTAIHTLMRNMEQNVYTYDEGKMLYLDHLRFWNHIFATSKIDYVFLSVVPHHCHEYIIYALAHIYGCICKTLINTSIPNRPEIVDNLEKPNPNVIARYEELRAEVSESQLAEDFEKYYNALKVKDKSEDKKFLSGGTTKKNHAKNMKKKTDFFFSRKERWHRQKHYLKRWVMAGLHGDSVNAEEFHDRLRWDRDLCKRARIKKHQMKDIKYYNSLTVEPDFDEKFIVFFMHLQPEGTTLPQGGVFVEQELVAELLGEALKDTDIKLYIKEHYVQPYHMKRFYQHLQDIPNVKLIHADVESSELFRRCVATATITGTVSMESIINGKPTLIFGESSYCGAPGTYCCRTVEDCKKAIDDIVAGNTNITQHDVRAFLRALQDNTVNTNNYIILKENGLSRQQNKDNLVRYAVNIMK